MTRLFRRATVLAAAAVLLTAGPVTAHTVDGSRLEDDGAMNSGKETHSHDEQHGGVEGHLPAISANVHDNGCRCRVTPDRFDQVVRMLARSAGSSLPGRPPAPNG